MKKTLMLLAAFLAGVYVGGNATLIAIKYVTDKAFAETDSKYQDLV